jgi:catechol 2,3-dioxygenase-like lactoylglutathione lyase family enzyme
LTASGFAATAAVLMHRFALTATVAIVRIRRAMPVVVTDEPEAARRFYEGFLGFKAAMEEDGLLMFVSPSVPTTQIIVAWPSPTALDPGVLRVGISIEVEDVDAAYAEAQARDLEIVYPLTDEPWGIRRFFVREASGTVLNIASHVGRPGAA